VTSGAGGGPGHWGRWGSLAVELLGARGPHAHPPWRWLPGAAIYGHALVALIGFPVGVMASVAVPWWALPIPVLALAQGFPSLTRAALIRLGAWRALRIQAHLDWTATARDRPGVALLAVAACHLRRPHDEACAAWLDRALDEVAVVGPGAVTAFGVRAFTRGDAAEARRMWRFAVEFDEAVTPPWVAGWAADLLAAEAAAVGDRDRLLRELARPRMPRTAYGRFLRACDAASRGEPEGVNRWLWLALTPSRSLLALARRMPDVPRPSSPQEPAVPAAAALPPRSAPVDRPAEPLTDAVTATLVLSRGARLGPELPHQGPGAGVVRRQVAVAADAWERALGDPRVAGKIVALAAGVADPVATVRARVVDLLAERMEAAVDAASAEEGQPEAGGELYQEVVWRAADKRDIELGWLADEIGHRTTSARELPLVEEVRAFCALVEAYERVLEMAPDRASASFPRLYYPVVRHTVWLHNRRGQARAAKAMYRVELRFAELSAHDSGVALLSKNLACGP
jgi:hypothetical protein